MPKTCARSKSLAFRDHKINRQFFFEKSNVFSSSTFFAPRPTLRLNPDRQFSKFLRAVEAGESFTVTSHGRPVARIRPVSEDAAEAQAGAMPCWIAFWQGLRSTRR